MKSVQAGGLSKQLLCIYPLSHATYFTVLKGFRVDSVAFCFPKIQLQLYVTSTINLERAESKTVIHIYWCSFLHHHRNTMTDFKDFLSWKANVWKTTININNIFFFKKKNISKELWTWICHSLCFYRTATVFSTLFYCLSFVPLVVYYLFAPLAKVEILKCELQMRTFTATIIPVPHCSLELHAVWTCSHGCDAHWCDALPYLLPPDRYLHCMLVAPNLGQRCKAGLLPKEVSGLVTSSWYRREDWSRPLLRGCYIEWIG